MEENKTPVGIRILGILHIIIGIPLVLFWGLGLYFIALGWGLLKVKPWARTVTMATYLILLVITLFFLPESILVVIISVIILLYLTYYVKIPFGMKLSSQEDRLTNRIKSQKAGSVGRNDLYKTYKKDAIISQALGNSYAREGKKTKEAIETYIEYIRFKTSQTEEDSKRVYSLLESVCHIDESEKDNATKLKKAMSLNQRVLNANSQVEWAHYYLGLGYFLKRDFNRSFTHLTEAQKLNPNQAATNHYLARTNYSLGNTFLEDGAIENALSAFRESLQLDPNQADAAFQVGKILIDQLDGV